MEVKGGESFDRNEQYCHMCWRSQYDNLKMVLLFILQRSLANVHYKKKKNDRFDNYSTLKQI